MPDCDYCEQSFSDEGSLLEHMGEAHEGELGRIDQRRVDEHYSSDGFAPSSTIVYGAIGALIVVVIAGAVYATVTAFSGGDSRVHEHGTINMTVEGEQLEFSSPRYTDATGFHFHGSGPTWHMHPSSPGRLTLAEAMDRLGIGVTEDTVTYGGQTYDDGDPGTNVTVRVNGEPVDPSSYELHGEGPTPDAEQGDHVRIVVEMEN